LSIIQNGKIPTFIDGEIKEKVFSAEGTNEACISELQQGLKKVGIYQVSLELMSKSIYKNVD
jgi:hypothetical protein